MTEGVGTALFQAHDRPDRRARPRSARPPELNGQGIESEEPDGGQDEDESKEQADGERDRRVLDKWHVKPAAQDAKSARARMDFVRVMRGECIHGRPPPQ